MLIAGSMVEAAIGSPSGSEVLVSMKGTAGLHIEGKTQQLSLSEREGELLFEVPPSSVDTGIALRNRHMLGYLDATHHPEAELHMAWNAVSFPPPGKAVESDAQGTLTLHGVSRPCSVHYRAEQTRPGEYRVHGTTGIDIRDFGIARGRDPGRLHSADPKPSWRAEVMALVATSFGVRGARRPPSASTRAGGPLTSPRSSPRTAA